ncbi:MAG: hypothetical protein C0404_12030, partial [Verrucomicrobia bacterium]|nr:hypothetical protein [Verrucomicrobiota bacterium]
GGGSGGGIILAANVLSLSGTVEAKGGDGQNYSNGPDYGGGGGGGRIAFYCNNTFSSPPSGVSVEGGTATAHGSPPAEPGTNGTFRYNGDGGDLSFPFAADRPLIENSGAGNLTGASATLLGNLAYTGTSATAVWVYWGTNSQALSYSATIGNQVTGTVATTVSGLLPETTYYFLYFATNSAGGVWAPAVSSFRTLLKTTTYSRKMRITFSGYDRSETLTNFPALVVFGTNLASKGFSYGQVLSSNGWDLRFLNSNETQVLNYETDSWATNTNSYVWVQVPILSSSNDSIWAYWGNNNARSAPAPYTTNGATWDNGFRMVYHMKEVSGNAGDSTANGFEGTNTGINYASGYIGNAATVGVETAYFRTLPVTNSILTASLWYYYADKGSDNTTGWNTLFCKYGGAYHHLLIKDSDGHVGTYNFNTFVDSGVVLSLGNWYHLTAVMNGTSYRLYRNGDLIMDSTSFDNSANNMSIMSTYDGNQSSHGQAAKGSMDEVRIESVARSGNWVWAYWQNMASNSVFNSYGTVSQTRKGTVYLVH